MNVIAVVIIYAVVSSLMLVVNSEAVKALHLPATISTTQFMVSILLVLVLQRLFPKMNIDRLEWKNFKPYLPFGVLFGASIFFNMQALQFTGVGTVIAFRSLMPLAVCGLEFMFLGRELPSRRSTAALFLVFIGVCGYVSTDTTSAGGGFMGYVWIVLWFFTMAIHMAYGKFVLQNVTLKNKIWGSMLYTNLAGTPIQALCGFANGEHIKIFSTTFTTWGISVFILSLAFGCGMSYISWLCMDNVSATQFTLIGVVNKVISILADFAINPQHVTMIGFLSLCLCIGSSSQYRQPPMREDSSQARKENYTKAVVIGNGQNHNMNAPNGTKTLTEEELAIFSSDDDDEFV
eukprot:GEMP01045443.1.p1 GENE.GEMP01045443.1~~GEMP01045443.1.p1  ORF type:complete len:348 (+),score=42.51 GEMP01045443.1:76-1119(+)